MGRIITGQIIATTGYDADGVKIPEVVLREFAKRFATTQSTGVAHDLSVPPACRGFNGRVEKQPSGEFALVVDMEVLDEEAYATFGGFSIAFTWEGVRFGTGPVVVGALINPQLFDFPEAVRRIGALQLTDGMEVQQYIQRGQRLNTAIITLVIYAATEFSGGFIGEAGKAAFDALRGLPPKHPNVPTEIHLRIERPGQPVIIMPIDPSCPAERLGEIDGPRLVEEIELHAAGTKLQRAVVSVDANGATAVEVLVDTDGRPVQ